MLYTRFHGVFYKARHKHVGRKHGIETTKANRILGKSKGHCWNAARRVVRDMIRFKVLRVVISFTTRLRLRFGILCSAKVI